MEPTFDTRSMAPGDAVVALRSLPRRWRSAFAIAGEDHDLDEGATEALVRRRPAPEGVSALERAAEVSALLGRGTDDLRRILMSDRPVLGPEPESPATADGSTASVLDGLAERASALADAAAATNGDEWTRTGTLEGGRAISALDLVRDTVARAVGALRAAERTIAEVRGRP